MYYIPAILDMALTMQLAIFLEKIASLAPTPNSEWEFVCSNAENISNHFQVTFRQLLTMLAIFDISFIACASISFSLPQLSSDWRVSMKEKVVKKRDKYMYT